MRKAERRKLIKTASKLLNGRIGLYSTPAQIRAAAMKAIDKAASQVRNA